MHPQCILATLVLLLFWLSCKWDKKCKCKDNLLISLLINHIKITSTKMAVSLSEVQFVEGQVSPVNRLGGPAKVEAGTVEYLSSDPSVASVEEDPSDETKFKIVAHAPGVCQVDISADADLGEGVSTVSGFVAVEVLPEAATGFGVTFGAPQDQA